MLLSAFALLILAACGTGSKDTDKGDSTASEKPDFLNLLTGGTQGTYYALGGTFADLISKETDIKTTAGVSQASAANMTALQEGKGEIAFVQSDIAYYATEGTMMFEGKKN